MTYTQQDFLINFRICDWNAKLIRFVIYFRGTTICNIFLTESEKYCTEIAVFKAKLKEKILLNLLYR